MNYYCGNGEDRTIAELLGPGYESKKGFYIDIGAHSPHHESVTKHFYELGYRGINVEPQANYYLELINSRQGDFNVNNACGSKPGILKLFQGDGLTTAIKEFAHTDWIPFEVTMTTLTQICDNFDGHTSEYGNFDFNNIDFLKVDVEGLEKEVLLGMDFTKYRPKVLCIEATIPMSQTPCFEDWEPIVLNANYKFAKMDYNNRYYTRKEGW